MAAVVEAKITSRNCSISSSSSSGRSSSCNSSSIMLSLLQKKIAIVMAVIIAKIRLRIFRECPKTSDHNSNATPFTESHTVLILSLRAALRLI